MTPFLQQVAHYYIDTSSLEDYCFIFPNRRSGQFFTDFLQKELVDADRRLGHCRPHLLPSVTSINELVTSLTRTVVATDIEMIFALYEAYCLAMGEQAQEFDKFIYWAQLIIGDFNDIDKSLADAHEIYSNLDDLHSLSSNYLSTDVKEKVERIFGESLFTAFFDTSAEADLWQHRAEKKAAAPGGEGNDAVKQEFVSLWNALGDIYDRYHNVLNDKGVVTPGRQLRQAAMAPPQQIPYEHLVFVGFGVLSAAEVKLFDHFKQEGKADFWWDNAGLPAMLEKAPHDPGALLVAGYCERFGAKPLELLDAVEPALRVVSVPSVVGQAKLAFDEVASMTGAGEAPGINTAIVLPDENLLVPLLHSVGDVSRMNVTLGYPLRSSAIVSLMHIVARMHHQASKEHDVWTYYRDDVNDILSHPLIKTYFTTEAVTMSIELAKTNRFRVPAQELSGLSFHDLFEPAMDTGQANADQTSTTGYLDQLMAFCDLLMDKMNHAANGNDDHEVIQAVDKGIVLPLQHAFLVMYVDLLNQLKVSLTQCKQVVTHNTLFYLIDRIISSAVVPFTGEPLQGLQIMGLLETRSLDFENVVILSANERMLPRRLGINSFIPNYMRRAHGMSTTEQQEAIMSFNFYRLLNRARRVTLVCDSGNRDGTASEPSRYITQLEKIYGRHLERVEMSAGIQTSSPIAIEVANPGREALTAMYLQHHDYASDWFLSASAINMYINCPLAFYLHHVQGLNDDSELSDFMDYGTFGVIVHDVLMACYQVGPEEKNGHTYTADEIKLFKDKRLDATVVYFIKKHYLHVPQEMLKTDDRELTGEAFMLVDTIKSYVNFVLNHDLDLINEKGPFTVLECERRHELKDLEIGGAKFDFTYLPDRVDRLADGTVRIVDYKTGKDHTSFSDVNKLFDSSMKDKSTRPKAILQLFLYSYAYLTEHPEVEKVAPVIYKLMTMSESGVRYKQAQYEFSMASDNDVAQDFMRLMGEVIKSMFEDGFKQCIEESSTCNYCRFIDFCRRSVKESFY